MIKSNSNRVYGLIVIKTRNIITPRHLLDRSHLTNESTADGCHRTLNQSLILWFIKWGAVIKKWKKMCWSSWADEFQLGCVNGGRGGSNCWCIQWKIFSLLAYCGAPITTISSYSSINMLPLLYLEDGTRYLRRVQRGCTKRDLPTTNGHDLKRSSQSSTDKTYKTIHYRSFNLESNQLST